MSAQTESGNQEIFGGSIPEGQAESTPDEGQAPEAAPSVDYAALEAQASEIAPGMTLPNLIDSYKEARSQLGRYQNLENEHSRLKRDYQVAEPLIKSIKEDPNFAQHLTQAAQEFYQGENTSVDSGVTQALNPLTHKLQEIEMTLAARDMQDQIGQLRQDPAIKELIDENVERQMWERVQETGSSDMNAHFWAVAGPKALQHVQKTATKQTTEQIQAGHKSYVPLDGSGTPQKSTSDEPVSEDEIISEIGRMMRG